VELRTQAARAAVGLGLVLVESGCAQSSSPPPSSLSDGTPVRPPPVALAGVDGPSVATRERVFRASTIRPGTAAARCVGPADRAEGVVVERVDVRGSSVTHAGRGRRTLHACETSGSGPEEGWCGRAFGKLESGRLRDPRLSLTCRTADDESVAFAWIEPDRAAVYVTVAHPGYHEVYRAAGDVPVRVSTADVDLAASTATFRVSEHSRDGGLLRDYTLEAEVSG
jgi:hypothetical protein